MNKLMIAGLMAVGLSGTTVYGSAVQLSDTEYETTLNQSWDTIADKIIHGNDLNPQEKAVVNRILKKDTASYTQNERSIFNALEADEKEIVDNIMGKSNVNDLTKSERRIFELAKANQLVVR